MKKISVCILTYNHEKYIESALKSVINQDVAAIVEVVIGDDLSSDKTRQIISKIANKSTKMKFKCLFPNKKIGMMNNLISTLAACSGDYIAMLEGDDFWTCKDKLAKQLLYLEKNTDCAICFHNVLKISEDNLFSPIAMVSKSEGKYSQIDIINENFIPTVSVFFRNNLFKSLPSYFAKLGYGDWFLHIMNSNVGKIGYIKDLCAVYRVHKNGVTSSSYYSKDSYIANINTTIVMYQKINEYTNYIYDKLIRKKMKSFKRILYLKEKKYIDYFFTFL